MTTLKPPASVSFCSEEQNQEADCIPSESLKGASNKDSQVTSEPLRTWSLVLEAEPQQSELPQNRHLSSLGEEWRGMIHNSVHKVGYLSSSNLAGARKTPEEPLVPVPW